MAIKVTKSKVSSNKIASEIDIFDGVNLTKESKRRVAEDVSDLLKTTILEEVSKGKSPLSGLSWPKLNPSYKKFKESQNLPGKANLEFTGQMLDDFDVVAKGSGTIELNVTGKKSVSKADGHNNFSGESDLPLRRFLPKEENKFKKNIEQQINDIVAKAVSENLKLSRRKFSNVKSKAAFFGVLKELFPGFSNTQISDAIISNEDLLDEFTSLGLVKFLNG